MKRLFFLFLFFLIVLTVFAGEQTTISKNDTRSFWSGMRAKQYTPKLRVKHYPPERFNLDRSWSVVDSIPLKFFLNSTASGGYFLDIHFDRNTNSLHTFCSDPASITETAEDAVNKAPAWMRARLRLKFQSIPSTKQNLWANLILNTTDPYVDEVAFSVATLSPAYLMSSLANPEVILANAMQIYLNDISINYADVIDYGTSNDDDYYSTVRYWKMDEDGNLQQVELPKMIYYWYVAHPKITDEIPAFIDPTVLEYDHHANIVPSQEGYFWRDYIFANTFHDTLNLRDMIANCQYVWDGIPRAYLGSDWFAEPISPYGDSLDYAIHLFTKWINGDMQFTSPGDRPHQPVRIAYKGMGRCGEYADLNAAVARALLIPATSISNWVNIWDHTFSELWQEGFIHYESYYWEWGTSFYDTYSYYAISPYEVRSDGYLRTVTQHYLDYSTLNIYILDANDYPLDGAKVKLYVERPDDGIRQTMQAYTDNDGLVTFTVSDSFPYYASAETSIGNVPASGTALLIESPVDGETYNLALNSENTVNLPQCNQIEPPIDNTQDYKMEVQFNVSEYAIRGTIAHDDIDGDASTKTFDKINDNGSIDFYITDQNNSDMFTAQLPFDAVYAEENTNNVSYEYDIPDNDNWHFIFSTANHLRNAQYIDGYVKLYQYSGENAPNDQISQSVKLLDSYPNPFNLGKNSKGEISIKFYQNKNGFSSLEIFNLKGRKVKTLINKNLKAGYHNVKWDGRDANNKEVASGIYLYRLKTGKKVLNKKLIVIK